MDPAPRPFAELPIDADLGVPVPFACGTEASGSARDLDGRRVVQCALSRVCGVCGASLGRPVTFFGSPAEADRNAFHFPPTHLRCAERLLAAYLEVGVAVLGQDEPVEEWTIVTTGGFEYVRHSSEDLDPRPTFQPNSRIEERPAGVRASARP